MRPLQLYRSVPIQVVCDKRASSIVLKAAASSTFRITLEGPVRIKAADMVLTFHHRDLPSDPEWPFCRGRKGFDLRSQGLIGNVLLDVRVLNGHILRKRCDCASENEDEHLLHGLLLLVQQLKHVILRFF